MRTLLACLVFPALTWAAPIYLFEFNFGAAHADIPPVGSPFPPQADFSPWTGRFTAEVPTFLGGFSVGTNNPANVQGRPYPDATFSDLVIFNSVGANDHTVLSRWTSPTLGNFRYHSLAEGPIPGPGAYGFGGELAGGPFETRFEGTVTITAIPEPRLVVLMISGLAALIALRWRLMTRPG